MSRQARIDLSLYRSVDVGLKTRMKRGRLQSKRSQSAVEDYGIRKQLYRGTCCWPWN